jgi:hypothetical protein
MYFDVDGSTIETRENYGDFVLLKNVDELK